MNRAIISIMYKTDNDQATIPQLDDAIKRMMDTLGGWSWYAEGYSHLTETRDIAFEKDLNEEDK